jgi:uncharacterized protein
MLEKEIAARLKNALKERKQTELSVLRMLVSEINNKKIADLVKGDIDDAAVLGLIQKMARRHMESIESFQKGGRDDLVKKEQEELAILTAFLPEQISDRDLTLIVEEAVKETRATSIKEMGVVMNLVMSKVKGRADGKVISSIVKDRLSQ